MALVTCFQNSAKITDSAVWTTPPLLCGLVWVISQLHFHEPSLWNFYFTVEMYAGANSSSFFFFFLQLFLIAMFAFACRMGWYTRTQRWGRRTTYPLRCSSRREGKAATGGSVTGGLWAWCFMKCWSVSNTTDPCFCCCFLLPFSLKVFLLFRLM